MARKITISFKETTKDLELFTYLDNLEDKSTEIKNLIRTGSEVKGIEKKENRYGNIEKNQK